MSDGDSNRVGAERPRGRGRAIPRCTAGERLGRGLGFDGHPRVRAARDGAGRMYWGGRDEMEMDSRRGISDGTRAAAAALRPGRF